MSLETWQRELRRLFGRGQRFALTNVGAESMFSDFDVRNPQNSSKHRVAIRGVQPGENYCSCADFATNTLGTCKHIEFVLGRLERHRPTAAILRRGFEPPHSEVVLHYGAKREVRFRRGSACPRALETLSANSPKPIVV